MIKIHRCEQEERVNNKKEKRGGKIEQNKAKGNDWSRIQKS